MATRKQVSDTLKSIRPTKQILIYLLYKMQENTNIIVVVAYSIPFFFNQTEFSRTYCLFFITEHKEFLKHTESPIDVALFFVL